MTTALIYADLLEACRQPGCPLCRLTRRAVRHYLHGLFYEKVNNVELRQFLRDSLGFCNEHAWISFEPGVGDVLGGAIIYEDVIKNVLRRLNAESGASSGLSARLRGRTSTSGRISAALKRKGRCLGCVQRDELDELHIMALISGLKREEMRTALAESDGLCLPHLAKVADQANDEAALEHILAVSREKLAALETELAELIRKFDYRFSQESHGDERDAWYRALRLAIGEPPLKSDD